MGELVSLSKAKRILGSKAKGLTDTQIIELVNTLHLMAREHICYDGSKKEFRLNGNNTSQKGTRLHSNL